MSLELEWIGSKAICQLDRSQYVRIGSTTSQALTITRGVPQGFILGPCFLIYIYINDLSNVPKESSLESYVDDTYDSKIFLSFPIVDVETAATKLSEDMNRITILGVVRTVC